MSREVSTTTYNANEGSLTNMRISSDDEEYEEVDDGDNDEDCGEEEEQALALLGFVSDMPPKHEWSLLRDSKAGGTPAWLNPINLPYGKSCLCDICGQPLRFMLQLYVPLAKKKSIYDRILYVFMCTSMSCFLQDQHEQRKHHPEKASRSIKVFRCQLPCHTQFYSSEPPKNNGSDKPLAAAAPLCSWCGTWKGDKVCSNCKRVRYCSKAHQAIHWSSTHKTQCRSAQLMLQPSNSGSTNSSEDIQTVASSAAWPEYEIIEADESESENINAYEYGNALGSDNEDEGDAKSWAYFTQRIARHPAQILRYCNETSKPLWPMLSGRPSKADIPKCSSCGSDRAFEFQILPQLLYFFKVENDYNSLDWATIVVYTCEASCDGSLSYEEEFSWVQLTSQSR
ncbi:putative programmed cell death protein [Helianthus annuus]|uniref:Programmed cell death protein n=1 Tax=Helianthus annuus TaxID=4232 RepID=A0A9K3J905_HELAN|nr:programmed cell death protein 2 [Helianthus annuus]KAF5810511.1 putative programmed cell death protein [Helianthus annuus]KAJ0589250.1 putative programmed cell death protein [Helianthus annuus]KAJ0931619.1 putative programmed cell death protein [Helianthus annuus]